MAQTPLNYLRLPVKHTPQVAPTLPVYLKHRLKRVSHAHAPVKLLQVSRTEMEEELQRKEAVRKEGDVYLLIPQKELFQLNNPNQED